MRFSAIVIAMTAAVAVVSAAPTKEQKTASDLKVLNYALTLENLESEFYKQGLAKYDAAAFEGAGFDSKVRDRFVHIGEHESEHVSTLTSVIKSMKGEPVPICQYKFPLDDLTSFLAVAQALENTGVSAYLGAAAGLSGDLLTAAAAITTVEARHASYLNELWKQSGAPYAFDTPLSPKHIVTIASNFIESCPYDLGVAPFKQLTATMDMNSTMVQTSFEGEPSNRNRTWCQFLYSNKVAVSPRSECMLPEDATGYFYVVVTNSKTPITLKDEKRILAGPALLFNGNHSQ